MNRALKANIATNLLFYRRNRLLTIVGILFLAIMMLSLIPSWFFTSANERFRIVLQVHQSLVWFMTAMLSLMALVSIWYHRSNKCVKLVFTRPCSPEVWVAAHYLSAALVFLAGLLISLLLFALLSLVWHIPFQFAVFASLLNSFVHGMLVFAFLLLLSSIMHPVLAGFVYLVFWDNTFYWLALLCRAGAESLKNRLAEAALWALHYIFYGVYYILPTTSPFAHKLQRLDTGLRMSAADLWPLAGTVVYLLLFVGFSYALTAYALRRGRMN